MTKIEHTKTHRIVNSKNNFPNGQTIDYGTQVLVTDAELVLVECEEVKHAILHNIINKNGKFYKPILISRTEKIKIEDWFLQTTYKGIFKCTKISDKYIHFDNDSFEPIEYCHKILALPEHFSPQQLQDIVDSKLKEGKCLVECEQLPLYSSSGKEFGAKEYAEKYQEYKIKLNPHITIYSVEEKMYTRDEVNQVVIKYLTDYSDLEWKEWFEQNVK